MSQGKAALERENQKDYDPLDPEVKQNPLSILREASPREARQVDAQLGRIRFEFDSQGGSCALSKVHAVLPAPRGEVPVQTRPN